MMERHKHPDTDQEALAMAEEDRREGKAPSTQAGEFVREEIHHVREGKHGARSTKQAIAIGLSKARRSGVDLPVPKEGTAPKRTIEAARRQAAGGKTGPRKPRSTKRSRATKKALRREGRTAANRAALSQQAKSAARRRGRSAPSRSAKKAARTRRR